MTTTLFRRLAAALLVGQVGVTLAADAPAAGWPEKIVAIEDLKPLVPFRIAAPRLPAMGTVRGPSTLRAHVDSTGGVREVTLFESCGNPTLDEAALHALQAMRFKPYTADGVPIDVTLILPVHIPKNLGRSRQGR